jgi:hypothetical protein
MEKNMNNKNAFAAHLQEQGRASCSSNECSACLNLKTMEIYTPAAAHKIVEIRSPIAGLLQNRTGKEEQPEVPKTN